MLFFPPSHKITAPAVEHYMNTYLHQQQIVGYENVDVNDVTYDIKNESPK